MVKPVIVCVAADVPVNVVVRFGFRLVRLVPRILRVPPPKSSGEAVPAMVESLVIASSPAVRVVVPV